MADTNNNNNGQHYSFDSSNSHGNAESGGTNTASLIGMSESSNGVKSVAVNDLIDFDRYLEFIGAGASESNELTIQFSYLPPNSGVNQGDLGENGLWRGTLSEAEQLVLQLPNDFQGIVTGSLPIVVDNKITHGKFHVDIGNKSEINLSIEQAIPSSQDTVSVGLADALSLNEAQVSELQNAEGLSIRIYGLPEGAEAVGGVQLQDGSIVFSGTGADLAEFSLILPSAVDFAATEVQISKSFQHGFEALIPLEDYDVPEGDVIVGVTDAMHSSSEGAAILVPEGGEEGVAHLIRLSQYLEAAVTDLDGSETLTEIALRLENLAEGALFSYDGGETFTAANISDGVLTYRGPAAGFDELYLSLPADYSSNGAVEGIFTAFTNEDGRASQGFLIQSTLMEDVDLSAQNTVVNEQLDTGATVHLGINASVDGTEPSQGLGNTPDTVTIQFDRLPEGTTANGGTLDVSGLIWTGTINEVNALTLTFPQDYSTTAQQVTVSSNLIVNGSFEQTYLDPTDWGSFMGGSGVPGWSGEKVELQNIHWGHSASNGQQWLELDAQMGVDTVFQDVQTQSGAQYQLSFDVSTRFFDTSTFDVSWNGEVISTVIPEGRQWETVTFTVEGTGGMDRLAFTELASQNSSFGAFIDNVQLVETVVMEEAPIVLRTTITTPEGTERVTSTVEVQPTQDIHIEVGEANYMESDAPLMIKVADFVSIEVSDIDSSEALESITVQLEGLPAGTLSNAGTLEADGTFLFTGSPSAFEDLILTFPKDYSTENPQASISGSVSAASNEGETSAYPIELIIGAEGDLEVSYTQAIDTTGDVATIYLTETDVGNEGQQINLADYFAAQATDADSSESFNAIAFEIANLPENTEFSTDGGETFSSANILGDTLSYRGPTDSFSDLVLFFPADYSTAGSNTPIFGSFTAFTDEGGNRTLLSLYKSLLKRTFNWQPKRLWVLKTRPAKAPAYISESPPLLQILTFRKGMATLLTLSVYSLTAYRMELPPMVAFWMWNHSHGKAP
ncbi:carbohydrate binding domain-containing protein [Flexibacterium corallicola]|uniref:hypothetical protein n=1 Tax=Flexibacterium corallicola TaxID=3037259 RepID=UPI00286F9281|nr:hypothetical protein [Pseudovibrio sp. M1P-2-3]